MGGRGSTSALGASVSAGVEQGLRRNRFRDLLTASLARLPLGHGRVALPFRAVIQRACMRRTPMVFEGVCRM
jgi:hypothetical protein